MPSSKIPDTDNTKIFNPSMQMPRSMTLNNFKASKLRSCAIVPNKKIEAERDRRKLKSGLVNVKSGTRLSRNQL